MTMTSKTVPKSINIPMKLRNATKRRTGCRQSQRSPSCISAHTFRVGSVRCSWNSFLIKKSETTEILYETASKRNGKDRPIPKRMPPRKGPSVYEMLSVVSCSDAAAVNCSLASTRGKKAPSATVKKTKQVHSREQTSQL